jgi:hypothetical protein
MEWEYCTQKFKVGGFFGAKIEQSEIDGALNEAGAQGWELVNTVGIIQNGWMSQLVFFFKRPK